MRTRAQTTTEQRGKLPVREYMLRQKPVKTDANSSLRTGAPTQAIKSD